jgi:hypothetical protein
LSFATVMRGITPGAVMVRSIAGGTKELRRRSLGRGNE